MVGRGAKDKRHSILVSFFLSYLLILIVPIVFGSVVYVQAEKIIESEINNSNSVILEQSRQSLDSGIKDVDRLISQISLNSTFAMLIGIGDRDLTSQDYSVVYQAVKDYQNSKMFNVYIDDYFIYLNKIDKVFCSQGLLDRRLYFDACWAVKPFYNGILYDSWSKIVQGEYSGKYIKLDGKDGYSGVDTVLYTQNIPAEGQASLEATVVIRLSTMEIMDAIQNKFTQNDRSVIILGNDDQILFFSGSDMEPARQIRYGSLGKQGLTYITYENKKHVVSYISSKVVPWKYVSVLPYDTFWDKVKFIRLVTLVGTSVCLLIGLLVSFLLSKRNYSPVRNLIEILRKRKKIEPGKRSNEYAIIQDALSDTMNENEEINKKLLTQNQALSSNFLAKLLKGRIEDTAYIDHMLKMFDIYFKFDSFLVALFYPMHPDESLERNAADHHLDDGSNGTIAFLYGSLVEAIRNEADVTACVFVTEPDDFPAFLINIDSLGENKQEVFKAIGAANHNALERAGVHSIVAISGIHQSPYSIAAAYQEALDTLEYGIVAHSGSNAAVILYEDIRDLGGKYDYNLDLESRLANFIKAGDYDNGKKLLDEIYHSNFVKRQLSGKAMKNLMLDINNTIMKALSESSRNVNEHVLNEINAVEGMLRHDKLQDMMRFLQENLKTACSHTKSGLAGRHDQVVEDVMAYVDEKFRDKNFSVSAIGEKFKLNAAYIARLFKDQTGEYLNDYISRVRVEESKRLLKRSDMSIKDIAGIVGYFSSNVFIRAFKRQEGVTPGIYKQLR